MVAAVLFLCGGEVAWASPVQAENALPGTSSWNAPSNNYSFVYASQIGIAPGDELDFHVSTTYRYRLEIFRMGWYGGAGARLVACSPSSRRRSGARRRSRPSGWRRNACGTSPTDRSL